MMQVAFGVSTWMKGLRNYLLAKQFDSATSDDLYSGLQQAVNEDYGAGAPNVATIFRTWETQSGYPLITVSRDSRVPSRLTLTQERFYYSNRTSSNLWWVPINYVVGSSPDFVETKPDLWLQGVQTLTLENSTAVKKWGSDDWIVVNIQESSYYRVNYDDNLWNLLIQQLNGREYEKIHLLNRAQLVDDSLNLARAGRIEYSVPFGILQYLSQESDYIPWAAVSLPAKRFSISE